jgi:hypothetical protein
LREAIKRKKQVTVTLKNYTKSGKIFYNELSLSPVRIKGKEYFIGIQQDVTKRVLAQEELEDYKRRLESLVEERTRGLMEANKRLMFEIDQNKEAQKKIIVLNEKLIQQNKRLEFRLIQKEERLTKREEALSQAMKENPNSSVVLLSRKTHLPISTVSVVRRRLLKENLDEISAPNIALFKLLSVVVVREYEKASVPAEAFFAAYGKGVGVYLMLNQDWHDFDKSQKEKNTERNLEVTHFSIPSSKLRFLSWDVHKTTSLSKKEAPVLYGLCKYEKKKLSSRLGLSIPTIQKYSNKLLVEKKYSKAYYHKLSKAKFIIISKSKGNLFSAEQDGRSIGISLVRDYEEQDVDSIVIPVSELSFFKFDFSGAVKKNFLVQDIG